MQYALPLSCLPGIAWPALPEPAGTAQLALLYQLEQSEKWPPEQLAAVQYRQLSELLHHAWKTSPFYRARLDAAGYRVGSAITPAWFSSLPLLSRQELQANFDTLKSNSPPEQHGPVTEGSSSGSTGRPIRFLSTEYNRTLGRTLVLRDHLWNQRDFSSRVAVIRAKAEIGDSRDWGPGLSYVYASSSCPMLHSSTPINKQAQWLIEQNPEYLLATPSNLRGLADELIRVGTTLPRLREIIAMGETLSIEVRNFCEATFKASIRDIYSASEVGYIAPQCQEGHYHLQENLLVEILDDEGNPVAPSQIGKVVITDLHNFASPLIRYAIGDYAEAGEVGCACGRSLKRLNRIMGRSRNLITLPDGRRFWPLMGIKDWPKTAEITRFQVVQKSLDTLEVRVEVPRSLTSEERAEITATLRARLGFPFQVGFLEMREMPTPENGKFEDFLSEVET